MIIIQPSVIPLGRGFPIDTSAFDWAHGDSIDQARLHGACMWCTRGAARKNIPLRSGAVDTCDLMGDMHGPRDLSVMHAANVQSADATLFSISRRGLGSTSLPNTGMYRASIPTEIASAFPNAGTRCFTTVSANKEHW